MSLLPRRLNARIILIISCILLVTGIVSGWITARTQTERHLAARRADAVIMARNFAESCAHHLLIQDYAELENFLLKTAELPDIRRLQVCEPNGALIWDVERPATRRPLAKTGIARLSPPPTGNAVIASENDTLVIWQPIVGGNILGWLKADFSLADIRQAQAEIWKNTLLLAIFWVVCSASMIILVLRPIVRAIAALTTFSKQLDEQKGAQISVSGQPLEIAELGASLNEASTRLLATERQIINEQELLKKSEKNYRQLIETIQEGIWVIDVNAITTFVNPRMAEILGYTPAEMIGEHLYAFIDEQGRQLADANIERRKQGIQEQHDFEFIRKTGERIYTRLETGPIFVDNGQYCGSIAAVVDITENRKAELRLQASEQLFRSLAENSPDVIVRYDREGRQIYVNPQFKRINRLSVEEVPGKESVEISSELAPLTVEFREKLMAAMASGSITKIDLSMSKEGKPSYWFVRIVPESNADGTVVSALTIWSDITERKQVEEVIHKLNEELEQRVTERTAELLAKNEELERLNRIFVGRELRMIELKNKIRELEKVMN